MQKAARDLVGPNGLLQGLLGVPVPSYL